MTVDVIVSLGFETYSDISARRVFPPDLLVEAVLADSTIDRVLVADPWRSYLSVLKNVARRSSVTFPSSPTRRHVAPHRFRRADSTDPTRALAGGRRYLDRVRAEAVAMGAGQAALIATHPVIAAAADPANWRSVTYYGWDDWAAHPSMTAQSPSYLHAYRRIAEQGHRVVGVTAQIVDRIGSPGASLVVPNGLREDEWLEHSAAPGWYQEMPRPRFLYTGTLDTRILLDHVRDVARAWPDGSVLLLGSIHRPSLEAELADLPNVFVRPWVPREVLRGVTFHCDVALIPHVDSDLTRAMSPLKLYEYLAAGRPVVATDLPAIRAVPGVRIASNRDEFIDCVRTALAEGPAKEADRVAFVRANAWPERMSTLLRFALAR